VKNNNKHEEMVDKYYPMGCTLDDDFSNIFSESNDLRDIKENRKKGFFDKMDAILKV